jgi:nucleoside-diphosphate-sugar epimerase
MSIHWKKRRVLVSGGTGFIGSFLVESLLEAGANVRVPIRAKNYRALSSRRSEIEWLEGDLRDPRYCAKLVRGVDEVFHLAACRRNVEEHVRRCGDIAAENVRMTLALLEAIREEEISPHVTFFSTANVPPSIDVIGLAQKENTDGYVLGKALAETLWFAAARQRTFPLLIVRPVGAYGPRDTFSLEGNVIPSLFVKARQSTREMVVWGSGKQERAFLYVEDLIGAVLRLRQSGAKGIQYVTSNDIVTVRELSGMIRDIVQPELRIAFDRSKPEGQRAIPRLPMPSCLRAFKWTPLEHGLMRTFSSWNG